MCCEKSQFPGQAHMPDQGLLSLGLTASCPLQAGFAAEGVESRTVFSDINLQEKVRDMGTLQVR